jgi:integral membrane protein|tara:strand:+ start:1273 stop:1554 length:282 start_codon:yes stop_codon:yes gene_type:complete
MIKLFRIIALLEGASYIGLLFIAVPLKYIIGIDDYVKLLGMPHGILFLLYVFLVFVIYQDMKWSAKSIIIILLASIIPFGTFYVDNKYIKRSL